MGAAIVTLLGLATLMGAAITFGIWRVMRNLADHEVKILSPQPGDILHIRVGIADMGDDLGPWIPTAEDLAYVRDDFQEVLPEGVKAVITHCGVEVECYPPPSAVLIEDIDHDHSLAKLYGGSD